MNTRVIKVSIIVPIYNAKSHISRCLDSLLNQTLQEIEIICVLDKPTDGTDGIVEAYAKRDERIVILRNETNLRVAESRNKGIQIAKGEYIGFHDHDDYNCAPQMYEDLYKQAQQDNADIVIGDAVLRYTGTKRPDELWSICDIEKNALIRANILPLLSTINPQMLTHCVWSSIYRRDFLQHNGIVFKDRREYLDEDRIFNLETYWNASKVSYIPKLYYIWEQYEDSTSNVYPEYLASVQITRTQFYVDYLKDRSAFELFQKDLWELLSVEMKVYIIYYANLNRIDWKRLGQLMRNMNYPLFGYKYGLKLFSRKRLQLLWYNVKARVL